MATVTIPDDVKAQAQSRASEAGYATVDEYVAALVRADAGAEADAELEAMLLQRIQSGGGGIELTPEFESQFRREVRDRRNANGSRP